MALLKRLALGAVAFATACIPAPTAIQVRESLVVYSVLLAHADTVTVFVGTSGRAPTAEPLSSLTPITDARVRIVRGADTLALDDSRPCLTAVTLPGQNATAAGCYSAAVPGGVQPDAVYELLVDVAGRPQVRGITHVPPIPHVVLPAGDTELFFNPVHDPALPPPSPLLVRWTSPVADRAELRVATERRDCTASIAEAGMHFGIEFLTVTADSAVVVVYGVHCGQPSADRYPAHLLVTVHDENYAQYERRMSRGAETLPLDRAGPGLHDAFGVFGAAATAAVPLTLVPR